jgi:hypothetical protein
VSQVGAAPCPSVELDELPCYRQFAQWLVFQMAGNYRKLGAQEGFVKKDYLYLRWICLQREIEYFLNVINTE